MGRFILIIVAATALFGALALNGGAGKSSHRTVVDVADHTQRVLAREIALSGHARAVRLVREDFAANLAYTGPERFAGAFQGGTYTTHVDEQNGDVSIVTRAQKAGTSYVIRETYLACEEITTPAVPDFMAYAIIVEDDLHVTGTAEIVSPFDMNANIHTNGRLTGNGTPTITGFGSYSNGVGNVGRLEEIFVPNVNPAGTGHIYEAPRVDVPEFNPTSFRNIAHRVTEGDLHLTDAVLGTRSNPLIWYVSGSLHGNGGRLSGYGIFIVEGNIRINGDLVVEGAVCGEHESSVAFYAGGNVRINGGATLRGQVFANGDISMNGTAILYGNMSTRGQVDLSGTFHIGYRYASTALTNPIWNGSPGPPGSRLVRATYVEGG